MAASPLVLAAPAAPAAPAVPELARHLGRRALWGAGMGILIGFSYFVAAVPVFADLDALAAPRIVFMELVAAPGLEITFLAVLLSVVFRFTRGSARLFATILAIVIALAAHPVVTRFYREVGLFSGDGVFPGSGSDYQLYTQWMAAFIGILFAVYYAHWEKAQASSRSLHAAQIAQQRTEHALLESRLNVVRARIDPAFLFEALGEVGRRYSQDAAGAEALLDQLIGFLRASLPRAQERASTLGEEFRLVESYLGLVAKLRGEPLAAKVRIDEPLRGGFFPPMVLMPLLEEDARDVRRAGEARRVALTARQEAGHVVVVLDDGASTADPDRAAVRNLRTTLAAFFGPKATVAVDALGHGSRLTIDYRLADAAVGKGTE